MTGHDQAGRVDVPRSLTRMHVLVLGGTQFIGRHVVEALLAGGHEVAILTRGKSPDPLPAPVERLRGDRDDDAAGLAALDGRTFDACVDLSAYWPRQVRASAERLRDAVGRYVFVSTIAVHGPDATPPVDESTPALPGMDGHDADELTNETYGPLKVRCEEIVRDAFGDRATILRPQVVAGPHDPYDRYAWWIRRAAAGGPTIAPGDGRDAVQVIDVNDLAAFVRTCLEQDVTGTFAIGGPRLTWRDFLESIGVAEPVWISHDVLASEGIGERELPLVRRAGGPWSMLMHVRTDRAEAAGLALSTPADTAARVRAWIEAERVPSAEGRLERAREHALLERASS